jgi:hypothetical protein
MAEASNIFIFVLTILVGILSFFSKYLFDKVQDHEKRIQKMEVGNVAGNALTKAHRAHVIKLIEDALSAK